MNDIIGYEKLIESFLLMWDQFPGAVRLIDKHNMTIAANRFAKEHGLAEGQICASIGAPESHRGCKKAKALFEQTAQVDRPQEGKIRAWISIEGYPDVVIHFALVLPEANPFY